MWDTDCVSKVCVSVLLVAPPVPAIHCTPYPLHPPLPSIQNKQEQIKKKNNKILKTYRRRRPQAYKVAKAKKGPLDGKDRSLYYSLLSFTYYYYYYVVILTIIIICVIIVLQGPLAVLCYTYNTLHIILYYMLLLLLPILLLSLLLYICVYVYMCMYVCMYACMHACNVM